MSADRRVGVARSFLAAPRDPVLGAALRAMPAKGVLAAVMGSDADGLAVLVDCMLDSGPGSGDLRWRQAQPQSRRAAAEPRVKVEDSKKETRLAGPCSFKERGGSHHESSVAVSTEPG